MSVPFEIRDIEPNLLEKVLKLFPTRKDGYVHAGSKNYFLLSKYREEATHYYNLELRPDDVWIVAFPRSGSTWTQEMAWLIDNDLNYERARNEKLTQRSIFFEHSLLMPNGYIKDLLEKNRDDPAKLEFLKDKFTPSYERVAKMKSPRHVKTHFPFSLLPPKLLDTCKVIYVARNPKDVAVSYFYLYQLKGALQKDAEFSQFWDLFQNDLVNWSPFWSHLEEAWSFVEHKNLLVLFYEDMTKDLSAVIRRTASFLGKSITDEQVSELAEYLCIDNFRKQPSLQHVMDNAKGMKEDVPGFYRKGESGAWRSMFPPELSAKADEWIQEHEKRTDISFRY
ncbi:sulfotransferase 1C4-like [Ischnura elegans]|uniref:sulfotransferase 1C4-like n=1 Tax=Ischnura elegans TaxID=197161 RepID=UPI001ED88CA4|nr:sulfotransferase 1C4-like [Ischnura elegans]